MKSWLKKMTVPFVLVLLAINVMAQRQMEYLNRGVVAVPDGKGNVFISWRLLASDDPSTSFQVYRSQPNSKAVLISKSPVNAVTSFLDTPPDSLTSYTYYVAPLKNGKPADKGKGYTVAAQSKPYHSIALQTPAGYAPNDASVGDVNGDGQYEIILHQTGRAKDNSQQGITDPPIFQAYTLEGKLLWQINLGKNIREGAHYTQFMVYDLDGDGKAEIAMKTADGTVDGLGNVLGDSSKDWRNASGYILAGPEYLTVFNGQTGAAISTMPYTPARYNGNLNPSTQQLKEVWGDGYGNRMDRFLACVAYLDGIHPSLIMCRGYYTRTVLSAWDFKNGTLQQRWIFDSAEKGNEKYAGQGNHNLTVADIDSDGKDEIVYGAMAIDDNGKGLYSTGLGHGDALHVTDLDPSRPGLEVFGIQERFDDAGASFRDARTGEIIWKKASVKAGDDGEGPGRGLSLDIDPRYAGAESWVAGAGITGMFDVKGNKISEKTPPCNMGIFWDGDELREILNSTVIGKWDYINAVNVPLLDTKAYDCVHNNGTKSNPVLSADIFGDWREEVIYRTKDNNELRIFSTAIPTKMKLITLMHDPQYRLSIAWQNVAYNQPPHTGFHLGMGMKKPAIPKIKIVKAP